MNSKFKPCPFCGNEPSEEISYEEYSGERHTIYQVHCTSCGIMMVAGDLYHLRRNWNHRDVGAALQEVTQAIATGFYNA